jgi:colanic acid/amylovoran biosynthesis glycosyltransferase
MRIAYLINQYPKVSHSFIRREIQALERRGFDIMRIALRGWDLELADPRDKAERDKTRYVLRSGTLPLALAFLRIAFWHPVRMLRALALVWRMSRRSERPLPVHMVYLAEACRIVFWLRAAGIHHLHAHFGTNTAEVAMQVGLLAEQPWSFTLHGPEEFDKANIIGLAEKLRRCSFVAAISSYGRSQIYRLLSIQDWPKVNVVHCGIEAAFHTGFDTPPPERPRLVCVGRLCAAKGQLLLVEAARRLAAQNVAFELVLAGDGELRPELETLIQRHGLQDKVQITGWISSDGVRNEILTSRALVLPSFAEGLPVVIMEAMALKRPVISTYIAGIPELVQPGQHGWLIPAGDCDELVQAMRACVAAPVEELTRMGEAGRARILMRHDVDVEAEKLVRLFQTSEPRV